MQPTKHRSRHGAIAAAALALALTYLAPWSAPARAAAELVMFDAKDCPICLRFNREVGPDYDASEAARVLPLRRIDLHGGKVDVRLKQPVTMTPTFVFVNQGAEIARFVGYPGRKYFFLLVNGAAEELAKVKAGAKAP